MSVLGSMDHEGRTQPRVRFATEANILRAQVERLRRKRRPLYLTMEAGALTRWVSGLVRPLVDRLVICETRHNRLINSNPTKSDEADVEGMCLLLRLAGDTTSFHGKFPPPLRCDIIFCIAVRRKKWRESAGEALGNYR